ncbi:SDR family NAD(P)-dependent oxidoreductase [Sphingomonas sp. ID0503]|uniref:SDR family NAD(P)-dependent oxidoreductase n=1 Tax=Sphingomonas sp. ID0503 TaxID=3399691 RepID=UPI003AFA6C13
MPHLLIFGLGYSASHLAHRVSADGWRVTGIRRAASEEEVAFHDQPSLAAAIASATHILSSVPPEGERDPVLDTYGRLIGAAGVWTGYLSSTGVYGDTGGAWVDESAPVGTGRRGARAAADLAWQAIGATVLRLPGIYGPGRSPLDRVLAGTAVRVDAGGQVFSRIHVDDIARAVIAAFEGPRGVYNIADDLPAPQEMVIAEAARCLGLEPSPLLPLEEASLSPAARAFYAENRRVATGKAKRLLGWRPLYPDYRAGLRALSAMTSPAAASSAPAAEVAVQR